MDETALSQGELYTLITNKAAHGKKGSLVAIIKGTDSSNVIRVLMQIRRTDRHKVKEITIDLSPTMQKIARTVFPHAMIVSDRFHVQQLMNEAVSDLRISHRWEAIEQENKEIALGKEVGRKFIAHTFENGDTRRQLLARSRYIVLKPQNRWTPSQWQRAEILFREYPDIEYAYQLSQELREIYNYRPKRHERMDITRGKVLTRLARWYNKVETLGIKYFNTVIQTMQHNYDTIINYFEHHSTNASAESFNAKIKAFRSQLRGIRDIPFFMFRLEKLFA